MSANGIIRELREQLAKARADEALVGEYRYPVPGHPAGDVIYMAAVKGPNGRWAVTDGTGRLWPTRYWNDTTWTYVHECRAVAEMYRYDRAQARELAQSLAIGEAAAHASERAKQREPAAAVAS